MADEGIFATTLQVQRKAGVYASAVANTEAYINDYMFQVESVINATVRFNFSDNFAGLNTDVKGLLTSMASDMAASYVIAYDMSSFLSRAEAENKINILRDNYLRGLSVLRDRNVQTFMKGA